MFSILKGTYKQVMSIKKMRHFYIIEQLNLFNLSATKSIDINKQTMV